jgi:hypothetical protein|tara:strand:- start:601 stop:864 length:264 start_codon:yes stop_codon:yes gene_type:complete
MLRRILDLTINLEKLTKTEARLQDLFTTLLEFVEKTSKSEEDSILLAGAMMGVAQMVLYDKLAPVEADNVLRHHAHDLVALIKPTIH